MPLHTYSADSTEWQFTTRVTNALTPLLISSSHTGCALEVLYAHPHISERSINKFIRDVQAPAPYCNLASKMNSVFHLTVRPSPIEIKSSLSYGPSSNINPSLPALTSLFPSLRSLTLRDTLIERTDDALAVFQALSLTTPEKVRLEVRMWRVSELARCDEFLVSSRPNVHGDHTRPIPQTTRTGPAYGTQGYWGFNGSDSINPLHRQWRDALYTGTEIELPSSRLDPEAEAARRALTPNPAPVLRRRALDSAPNSQGMGLVPVDTTALVADKPGEVRSPSHRDTLYGLLLAEYHVSVKPAGRALAYRRLEQNTERRSAKVLDRQEACRILESLGYKRLDGADQTAPSSSTSDESSSLVSKITESKADTTRAAELFSEVFGNADVLSVPPAHASATVRPGFVLTTAPRIAPSSDLTHAPAASTTSTDVSSPAPTHVQSDELRQTEDDMLEEGLRASRALAEALAAQEAGSPTSNAKAGSSSERVPSSTADLTSVPGPVLGAHAWVSHKAKASPASKGRKYTTPSARTESSSTPTGTCPEGRSTDVPPDDRAVYIPTALPRPFQRATTSGAPDGPTLAPDNAPLIPPAPDITAATSPTVHPETPPVLVSNAQPFVAVPDDLFDSDRPSDDDDDDPAANGQSSRSATAMYSHRRAIRTVAPTAQRATPEPVDLPTSTRALLRTLLEGTWASKIKAFSFVALDPQASMIVRPPRLDFWPNIAVPHIRVHLPRGVNSLAVFMGAKEMNRRRARQDRTDLVAAEGTAHAPVDLTGDNEDATVVSAAAGTEGAPAPPGAPPVYPDSRPAPVTDFIVGGDGFGGDLVHPENRLFEIEVNTIKEMTDDLWNQAGSQLPPQVCRILVGSSDWRNIPTRKYPYPL
jgi:hypothetical protein